MKGGTVLTMFVVAIVAIGGAVGIVILSNNGDNGGGHDPTPTPTPSIETADVILDSSTGVTTSGSGKYEVGSTVNISASTDSNTTFLKWVDADGDLVSETADYSFTVRSTETIELFAVGNTNVEWKKGDVTELYSERDWASAVWTIYKYGESNGSWVFVGVSTNGTYKFDDSGFYQIEIVAQKKDGSTVNKLTEMSIGHKIFEYSWWSYGNLYTVQLEIDYNDYIVAKNLVAPANRHLRNDRTNALDYITPNDKYVDSIADQISEQMTKHRITDKEKIANVVLDFVQVNIVYLDDKTQYGIDEYWAFPLETLYSKKGDCEDTTFLYSSIMENIGYDTVVCMVRYNDNSGHAFTMISLDDCSGVRYTLLDSKKIADSGKYYVCETTPDYSFELCNVGMEMMDYQNLKESYCFKTDQKASLSTMHTIKLGVVPAF